MKDLTYVKKITAFILSLLVMLSFSSCGENINEEETTEEVITNEEVIPGGSLSVPYTSQDSLNPYYCTSVLNHALTSLVYRSLYKFDASFSVVRDLAVAESVNADSIKVSIIPDLVFSDEGRVTADDVVYSFECAKKSSLYSEALSGFSSCTALDDEATVLFTLSSPDINAINGLIFPIVKKGTATSEDFLPIGNGFYKYFQDGIRLSLKANLKYAGELPEIGTVRLSDVKGNLNPENLLSTKEIDFCYKDLSDANITDTNTSGTAIYLNNLVYMGVNHYNINLVLASFRQAISFAIDRTVIADSAFMGYARAAVVPFNTSWQGYSSSLSASSLSFGAFPAKTQELLGERGFGKDGNPLDLVLVCSEGNAFIRNTANIIVNALKEFNINVTLQLLSPENLKSAVTAGAYDLYIGEIKIPATMDLTQFFTYGGNASYGINFENLTVDEDYFRYKKGEISLDDFITTFNNDMPFIPLAYRNGRFLYTRRITSELTASENFFFSDICKWTFSE